MGDSRFHLKGEFEVYGKKFKLDQSLNWSADPGECDHRISEWFAARHDEAYRNFQAYQYEASAVKRLQEQEATERAELARLQAKYGALSTIPAAGEEG